MLCEPVRIRRSGAIVWIGRSVIGIGVNRKINPNRFFLLIIDRSKTHFAYVPKYEFFVGNVLQ